MKQAADNDVPVYCPALTDSEVGDFLYYYRQGYVSEVGIEILDDHDSLIEDGLLAGLTGLIAVGGGVPKHHAIMTNLFLSRADFVVYISTGMEGDRS